MTDYLAHHGILGMKWGVRRFQNKDGSLTNAGRERYSDGGEASTSKTGMSSSTKKKIAAAALAAGAITVAAIYASKHPEQVNKVVNSAKDVAVNKLGGSVKKGASYVADFAKNATSALKQGYNEGIDDRKMKETNTSPATSKDTGLAVNKAKYQRNARSIGNAAGQIKETASYAVRNAPKKAMEGLAEVLENAPKNAVKKVVGGVVEAAMIKACVQMAKDAMGEDTFEDYRKTFNSYNKKNKIGEVNTKKKDDDDDED